MKAEFVEKRIKVYEFIFEWIKNCPEIISLPIENASEAYGRWIMENVKH